MVQERGTRKKTTQKEKETWMTWSEALKTLIDGCVRPTASPHCISFRFIPCPPFELVFNKNFRKKGVFVFFLPTIVGFNGDLLGLTAYNWLLLPFTGFYWVFLVVTRLSSIVGRFYEVSRQYQPGCGYCLEFAPSVSWRTSEMAGFPWLRTNSDDVGQSANGREAFERCFPRFANDRHRGKDKSRRREITANSSNDSRTAPFIRPLTDTQHLSSF